MIKSWKWRARLFGNSWRHSLHVIFPSLNSILTFSIYLLPSILFIAHLLMKNFLMFEGHRELSHFLSTCFWEHSIEIYPKFFEVLAEDHCYVGSLKKERRSLVEGCPCWLTPTWEGMPLDQKQAGYFFSVIQNDRINCDNH